MNLSRSPLYTVSLFALAALCVVLIDAPAHAQNAPTFYNMNRELVVQTSVIPKHLFKKITVLVGALTTYAGLHGFYKGSADPRNAAHLKNGFLLLIGGMFLATSFLALSAEKTVFGTNANGPEIRGQDLLNDKMEAFH